MVTVLQLQKAGRIPEETLSYLRELESARKAVGSRNRWRPKTLFVEALCLFIAVVALNVPISRWFSIPLVVLFLLFVNNIGAKRRGQEVQREMAARGFAHEQPARDAGSSTLST